MLKPIVGGGVGILLSFFPGMAQAQTPQPNPQVLAQVFAPRGTGETVSPLELQQFAQALKQLQRVEMEAQQKMVEALKTENLSPQRFGEIGQQRENPDFQVSTAISSAEQERFDKALTKIRTIQQEAAPKRSRAVTLQGLTVERFNQIGQVVDRNPALKEQLKNSL